MNPQTIALMAGLVVTITEILAQVTAFPRKWGGYLCIALTVLVMYLYSLDNPMKWIDALQWGALIASSATGVYLKGKEAIQGQLDKMVAPQEGSAGDIE